MPGVLFDPVSRNLRYSGRYEKPRYYCVTSPQIVVPAQVNAPVYLVIGGRVWEITEDLECNLNISGAGGLNSGTLTANTPYYLYAIETGDEVKLIADVQDPSDGPKFYKNWTYIGATATDSATATITAFNAVGGIYIANDEIETETVSAGGSRSSVTFASMPVTVILAWVQLHLDAGAAGANQAVTVSGTDSGDDAMMESCSVNSVDVFETGWVPVFTEKTLYATPSANNSCIPQLSGWKEDVNAWK